MPASTHIPPPPSPTLTNVAHSPRRYYHRLATHHRCFPAVKRLASFLSTRSTIKHSPVATGEAYDFGAVTVLGATMSAPVSFEEGVEFTDFDDLFEGPLMGWHKRKQSFGASSAATLTPTVPASKPSEPAMASTDPDASSDNEALLGALQSFADLSGTFGARPASTTPPSLEELATLRKAANATWDALRKARYDDANDAARAAFVAEGVPQKIAFQHRIIPTVKVVMFDEQSKPEQLAAQVRKDNSSNEESSPKTTVVSPSANSQHSYHRRAVRRKPVPQLAEPRNAATTKNSENSAPLRTSLNESSRTDTAQSASRSPSSAWRGLGAVAQSSLSESTRHSPAPTSGHYTYRKWSAVVYEKRASMSPKHIVPLPSSSGQNNENLQSTCPSAARSKSKVWPRSLSMRTRNRRREDDRNNDISAMSASVSSPHIGSLSDSSYAARRQTEGAVSEIFLPLTSSDSHLHHMDTNASKIPTPLENTSPNSSMLFDSPGSADLLLSSSPAFGEADDWGAMYSPVSSVDSPEGPWERKVEESAITASRAAQKNVSPWISPSFAQSHSTKILPPIPTDSLGGWEASVDPFAAIALSAADFSGDGEFGPKSDDSTGSEDDEDDEEDLVSDADTSLFRGMDVRRRKGIDGDPRSMPPALAGLMNDARSEQRWALSPSLRRPQETASASANTFWFDLL